MRMIYSGAAIAALVAPVLAGCSSGPQIDVVSSGTVPANGTYAIVEGAQGNVGRSVSEILAQHGLTRSETPDYIVQVSHAERPAGTGLLVPDDADAQWLRRPDFHHRTRPVATLGISIAAVADGRELYRASASGRSRPKGDIWAPLVQAILPASEQGSD
ncbi:hypothetical protein GCM10011494_35740 [Novosphingobium endophyticum]|uniref:Uncharacterized protein n=1 Tax=Novosphingobium endophyticum TaxID=1955250 RepID=A0A916TW21_9SPHN|nr:hypothetical protein [Novosphingobium endophyticum]GGC13731.1 hypothetical protein GCM10011494_35740 [Novosphingobium endophyticum]